MSVGIYFIHFILKIKERTISSCTTLSNLDINLCTQYFFFSFICILSP